MCSSKNGRKMKILRIFISYSTKDKKLAGKIKTEFEGFGFNVFLAHHDIHVSTDWSKILVSELRHCNVFLPLLTKNFRRSKWTDQEAGFALALYKSIFPIKIDVDPHGFMEKIQAFNFNREQIRRSCRRLFKDIRDTKELTSLVADSVIGIFAKSENFVQAGEISSILLDFVSLSQAQIKQIFRGGVANYQIYQSYKARRNLQELQEKFLSKTNREIRLLYRQFLNKSGRT